MKSITTALVLGVSLLLASGGGGYAQEYKKGEAYRLYLEAYEKGDYATASREWRVLANMGMGVRSSIWV
jgi:hypothetical protein